MPQVFMVVRCYACSVFQVQQVKKVPKWVCKMCGEKQSLKKEYGRGSGADCRKHVQKLNLLKASMENQEPASTEWDGGVPRHDDGNCAAVECDETQDETSGQTASTSSMWNQFMTDPNEEDPTAHGVEPLSSHELDNNRVTTDRDAFKEQRKRGGKKGSSNSWSGAGSKRKLFRNNGFGEEDFSHQQSRSISSSSYGQSDHSVDMGEMGWHTKQLSAKRNFTTATKKSSGANSALPSSNGRWGQFLEKTTHHNDDGEDAQEENTAISAPLEPCSSLNSASNKSSGAMSSSIAPKSSGRWGKFLKNQHYQEDSVTDVGLLAKNTIKSTSSKPSASSTTCTSSKRGQFLDTGDDEDTDESGDEFWPQDRDQVESLHQEQIFHTKQSMDAKSNDNEWMPEDDNKASSVDGFQKAHFTMSSSKATERATGESNREQNVNSLMGSSRWNPFVSNTNEPRVDNLHRNTGNKFVVGRQNESENKLVEIGNKAFHQNGSGGESKIQLAVDRDILSVEEHDLGAVFGPSKEDSNHHSSRNVQTESTSLLHSSQEEEMDPEMVATWKRNLLRIIIVLLEGALALGLKDDYAYFGSFVGAIGSTTLAFIMPCLLHLLLDRQSSPVRKIVNISIIAFGIIGGIVAVYVSVSDIIANYLK